jgi:hypothetical protein
MFKYGIDGFRQQRELSVNAKTHVQIRYRRAERPAQVSDLMVLRKIFRTGPVNPQRIDLFKG